MKSINSLKLMFFAALGVLGSGICYMTGNLKCIILIIGIAMILGVFFRMFLIILEIFDELNNKR